MTAAMSERLLFSLQINIYSVCTNIQIQNVLKIRIPNDYTLSERIKQINIKFITMIIEILQIIKAKRNYYVTRKELSAFVKPIEHFHQYFYSRKFSLWTDHAFLKWFLDFKEPEGQQAHEFKAQEIWLRDFSHKLRQSYSEKFNVYSNFC